MPRDALLAEIDAATAAVEQGLAACGDEALERPYPERMGGHTVATSVYLIPLLLQVTMGFGRFGDWRDFAMDTTGVAIATIGYLALRARRVAVGGSGGDG